MTDAASVHDDPEPPNGTQKRGPAAPPFLPVISQDPGIPALRAELNGIVEQLAELRSLMVSIVNEKETHKTKLDVLTVEQEFQEKSAARLGAALDNRETELVRLRERQYELEDELGKTVVERDRARHAIVVLRHDCEEWRTKFESLSQETSVEVKALREKVSSIAADLELALQENRTFQDHVASLEKVAAERDENAVEWNREFEQLKVKLLDLESEVGTAAKVEIELRQTIVKRDAAIRSTRRDLEQAQAQLAFQERSVARLKEMLRSAGGQIDKMMKSSRWKWGSYILFRNPRDKKLKGKMSDHLLEQFRNWAKTNKTSEAVGVRPKKSEPPPEPRQASKEISKGAAQVATRRPWGPIPTVIVPVFNAFDEVSKCLESLTKHCGTTPHRILVIDDCSTDERIWPLLERFAVGHPHATALRNDQNLGYTANVNRGCRLCEGDVILLNSDTVVTENWIEKLAACAYSRPSVATVTALSNAAGAFSIPENGRINEVPEGIGVDGVNALLEATTNYIRPAVPTGNGFCLYIRRLALDRIGLFDEASFPRGYGEENDFSMRAIANGLVNLVDDATFIYHKRTASFGTEKEEILATARKTLDKLHPTYSQQVDDWLSNDALDPLRARLREGLDLIQGGVAPAEEEQPGLLLLADSLPDYEKGLATTVDTSPVFGLVVEKQQWTFFKQANGKPVPVQFHRFSTNGGVFDVARKKVLESILQRFPINHVAKPIGDTLANRKESTWLLQALQATAGGGARLSGSAIPYGADRADYALRVTIISSTTNIHGGTKRLLQIAQLLHQRGHHVTFVRHFGSRELDWFQLDPPLREIRFDEKTASADLEKRLPDADVLLTYGNNRAATVVNNLSRRKGLKYLLYMHMGVHDRALDESNALLMRFKKLATTKWIADELGKIGVEATPIGFGAHLDQFYPVEASREFRVGTLIHKDEWKRSQDVIEAFKIVKQQFPQAKLVAFGQVEDPGLDVECEYYFNPDQDQLRTIYSSCAAWVTASLWEGIGMCSVEAMLCKTPLITTDTGGSRDFCTEENSIIVEKKSPQKIAAAIVRLLTDRALGERLAARAHADIQQMSWENSIQRLEQVLVADARNENPTAIARKFRHLTIGIPIHNQPEYVSACLKSIYENTISDFEIILVDDASDSETRELLRDALASDPGRVRYIRNETRKGFPYNCNRIISNAAGRYICLLNSDTVVTKNWDKYLTETLRDRPDLMMTGPSTSYGVAKNFDSVAQQLSEVHDKRFDMSYDEIQEFASGLSNRQAGAVENTEYLNGFCMMINREIIPKIGLFDEKFGLGSREEVEFVDRIRLAGFNCAWVKYAYVHHYGHRSFDPYGESSKKLWEANKQLYFASKNKQRQVLVSDARIAFVYNSKFTSSTRKRTFEIARKLGSYLSVETIHVSKLGEDVFRRVDIMIFQRIGGLSEKVSPEIIQRTLSRIERYQKEGKVYFYDIDDYVFDGQDGAPTQFMMTCDGVIASTPHLQNLARTFNSRSLCLKNGIDYDRFLAARPVGLDPAKFHVVCASLGAVGQSMLTDIARQLHALAPDIEIHFFRDNAYSENIPGVMQHSPVELDELFGFMKAADVVVNFDVPDAAYRRQLLRQYHILPSQLENVINAKSGLKYYNAGAAAKTFISTPRPICYKEMIRHGENGFIAETAAEFVELITRAKENPNLRREIGQRAFEDVIANYTLDMTIFEYLTALTKTVPEWKAGE